MDFNKVLKTRKSVRHYSLKKVPFQAVSEICEAGILAPMAGNILTVRFIIVSDKEKIKLLADAAQQPFIAQTQYVVVIYSETKQIKQNYGERSKIYIRQQAGAVIENLLLKTVDLGLSSCWIGWFDENIVKRVLFLPDEVQVEALLPIGYGSEKTINKKRPDLKLVTYFNEYKQRTKKPLKKIFA